MGSTHVSTEFGFRYMGFGPSLYGSHILSSCIYLALGRLGHATAATVTLLRSVQFRLLLAVASGPRVAVVVAANCFLPKFCSAFGKYLTLEESKTCNASFPAGVVLSPQGHQGLCASNLHLGFATEWRRTGRFSASRSWIPNFVGVWPRACKEWDGQGISLWL